MCWIKPYTKINTGGGSKLSNTGNLLSEWFWFFFGFFFSPSEFRRCTLKQAATCLVPVVSTWHSTAVRSISWLENDSSALLKTIQNLIFKLNILRMRWCFVTEIWGLTAPSSRVRQFKCVGCLSRNFGSQPPSYAAQYYRRVKAWTTPRRQPEPRTWPLICTVFDRSFIMLH